MASDKVLEIFKELAGERANRLAPTHYPADVNSRITAALLEDPAAASIEALLHKDEIGQNLVDWQSDAAFLVALVLFPERFTDAEIREGVESLLLHVPGHVMKAARLAGHCPANSCENGTGGEQ